MAEERKKNQWTQTRTLQSQSKRKQKLENSTRGNNRFNALSDEQDEHDEANVEYANDQRNEKEKNGEKHHKNMKEHNVSKTSIEKLEETREKHK